MSNANTIGGFINGTLRGQIPAFTISTTETAFSINTDTGVSALALPVPSQASVVGSATPHGVNSNPSILVKPRGILNSVGYGLNAPYFNSSSFDLGRPFNLRLTGTAATGSGAATTIYVYLGAPAIVGTAGSRISTLVIPLSTTGNFELTTHIRWDAVTAAVSGFYSGQAGNGTPVAPTALTNAVAAAAVSNLAFVVSAIGAAGATGTIQLSEFSLEQV